MGFVDRFLQGDFLDHVLNQSGRKVTRQALPFFFFFNDTATTESTPISRTLRRMKGITVVGKSMPCANPQAATAPP